MLIAIALLRSEPAIAFLISLLVEDPVTAQDALVALSHLQMLPQVRERVETAIDQTGKDQLRHHFRTYFRSGP